MTPMNMWIIIGICGLGIILGILRQIDWYEIFSKRWGNSPVKARVYIHFGRDIVFEDAEYSYSDDTYVFFIYQFRKQKMAIAIKQKDLDDYGYIRGRLMIHAQFGEGVTVLKSINPRSGKELQTTVGNAEYPERQTGVATIGATELDSHLRSKVAVELVNSVGNRGGLKIMSIIMIIAVVAGAVIFFKVYQDNQKEKAQQQQQQQQQKPPETLPPWNGDGTYQLMDDRYV